MKFRATIASILFAGLGGSLFNVRAVETGALQFISSDLQLGALTNGQNVSMTFVLTNRSDKIVKIVSVDTTCHCTSVLKSPSEISAHGSGAVESRPDLY